MRYVIELDGKVILVRGRNAKDVLRSAGLKPLWSVVGKGWVVDAHRLPDVRAAIEVAGGRYREVERGAA